MRRRSKDGSEVVGARWAFEPDEMQGPVGSGASEREMAEAGGVAAGRTMSGMSSFWKAFACARGWRIEHVCKLPEGVTVVLIFSITRVACTRWRCVSRSSKLNLDCCTGAHVEGKDRPRSLGSQNLQYEPNAPYIPFTAKRASTEARRCHFLLKCRRVNSSPGGAPVVVFHALPGGTSHSPKHAHAQSVSPIISRIAATNTGSGHAPSALSGHPRMPVSGTTPSFTMTRICVSGVELHESTGGHVSVSGEEEGEIRSVRWNWTLVAKGARCAVRNARLCGMWVAGSGPSFAKLVKFSAVSTVPTHSCQLNAVSRSVEGRTVEHDNLVRRVNVQTLPERKRALVVRERRVRRRVVRADGRMR